MIFLKGCPRCRGDVFQEQDAIGHYLSCLQCGKTLTAEEETRLLEIRRATGTLPRGTANRSWQSAARRTA